MTTATSAPVRGTIAAASLAILTAAFLWPALVTGAPWSFQDTASYYKGGAAAWAFLVDALGIADPDRLASAAVDPIAPAGAVVPVEAVTSTQGPVTDPVAADGASTNRNIRYGIRSVPYSMLVYPSVRFIGLWAPIVAMSFATAGLVWITARDLSPGLRLLIGLGLAATTALPFFGALFQPDILTAAVVLVPVVLMLHERRLGPWIVVGLFALLAFATLTHYGNLPLAALSVVWLGVWGLLRRRRLVVALVAAPLVAAGLVNLAIGVAIQSGPSLAPGRYPLLLARSIEDGPGRDYLTAACPDAEWALCEVYDEMPLNIAQFLWGKRSISEVATPEQLARISAEELPLLLAIVRYDPIGQTRAFLANATRQFFLYDSAAGRPARYVVTPTSMETTPLDPAVQPSVPSRAQNVVILLGAVALLWAVVRRRHPEAVSVTLFLLASLVVYAAVCGGLSAPVPRYQARLVWIVPLLGAVLALARPRVPAGADSDPARRRERRA